jgi:hypothetical protein
MSRGLGRLQRAILEVLQAHEPVTEFRYHGHTFTPTIAGLYDLRELAPMIAQRCQQSPGDGAFSAALSRAVRGLARRGWLRPRQQIPIPPDQAYTWNGRHKDGVRCGEGGGYVVDQSIWGGRQIRFIQKGEAFHPDKG